MKIFGEWPDGLYQVVGAHFVAGFVVKDGKITDCAPILRKNLEFWAKEGRLVVQDDHESDNIDHERGDDHG